MDVRLLERAVEVLLDLTRDLPHRTDCRFLREGTEALPFQCDCGRYEADDLLRRLHR